MLGKIVDNVFGTKNERNIAGLKDRLKKINGLEEQVRKLDDREFPKKTQEMRDRLAKNPTAIEEILPEAFALAREAAVRTLGLRMYDVQLIGALVLHQGKIAEMKTGEGKTLTATAAVYLNALMNKGVHLITVNDYLAKRDSEWMAPVYQMLGMKIGVIQANMPPNLRKEAYLADITYGTNNEFGFDYLRDNMVNDLSHQVQRGHYFGIVDEVDSILIDEARTPLIISGAGAQRMEEYYYVNQVIHRLVEQAAKAPPPPEQEVMPGKEEPHIVRAYYYDIDEKGRNVFLTEEGIKNLEKSLKIENLYAPQYASLIVMIQQSLKAHLIFQKEVDYMIDQGEVLIVDEHTGRTMPGRRYGEGLHQAIEAKEHVEIKQESQSLASITFQNYFRLYKKLAGMTGTAATEAEEFRKIYGLEIVIIPTHLPMSRIDYPDRVYRNEDVKFNAIMSDVKECVTKKQPVLLGTISIEKSEKLSKLLTKNNIEHSVLNAKHHLREAEIIANAGAPGRVTVATNMAGRGTDIVLGAAPQYLQQLDQLLQSLHPSTSVRQKEKSDKDMELEIKEREKNMQVLQKFRKALLNQDMPLAEKIFEEMRGNGEKSEREKKMESQLANILTSAKNWFKDHELVKSAGGVHIIGTERHDARRIDNQLRGRSGRQGDPGSSRFYLSLDDNLMRIFGGDRIKNLMSKIGMEDEQELEARMVDRAIARAQKRVENHHFDIRKHLLDYDEVMNKQREFVYLERDKILRQEDIRDYLLQWMEDAFEIMIVRLCPTLEVDSWDLASLDEWLAKGLRLPDEINKVNITDISQNTTNKNNNPQIELLNVLFSTAKEFYLKKIEDYQQQGFPDFSYVERRIALEVLDNHWKEHLKMVDHLREGVWASGYAERNPLIEFKIEGFKLFDQMIESVKLQITEYLFCVQLSKEEILKNEESNDQDRQQTYEVAAQHVAPENPALSTEKKGRGKKKSRKPQRSIHRRRR